MARQIRNHKAPERHRLLMLAVEEFAGRTVDVTHLRQPSWDSGDRVTTTCRLVVAAWPGVIMTHGSPLLVVQPVKVVGDRVQFTTAPLWIPSTCVITIERNTP